MAAVISSNIEWTKTSIEPVDIQRPIKSDSALLSLRQFHDSFSSITGSQPCHSLLLDSSDTSSNPFFHNACVYLPEVDEIWTTSDLLHSTSSSKLPVILISKIKIRRDISSVSHSDGPQMGAIGIGELAWQKLRPPPNMPMPAGACVFSRPEGRKSGILFCSQGNLDPGTGGLFHMPLGKPPVPLVTGFGGRPFNSPQQVAVHPRDGSLWFTDPHMGFEADIRPRPALPSSVWRYEPGTGVLRAVLDGMRRPVGIAFGPGGDVCYVSDAEDPHRTGDGEIPGAEPRAIYAFDVVERAGQPFLEGKRVFAFAVSGTPRTVKCDTAGNVYAACGQGVEIWSPGGVPLGMIEIAGGCSSFCFGRVGEILICAKQRLWMVRLDVRQIEGEHREDSSME